MKLSQPYTLYITSKGLISIGEWGAKKFQIPIQDIADPFSFLTSLIGNVSGNNKLFKRFELALSANTWSDKVIKLNDLGSAQIQDIKIEYYLNNCIDLIRVALACVNNGVFTDVWECQLPADPGYHKFDLSYNDFSQRMGDKKVEEMNVIYIGGKSKEAVNIGLGLIINSNDGGSFEFQIV